MPFATTNRISQSYIEDGIEISQDQYAQALEAMQGGLMVIVRDGEMAFEEPAPKQPEPAPGPENAIPQAVTRRQGRLALIDVGKLADVEAAIAAISDPVEQMKAQVEYEADTWERQNEFLQAMWAQLGGTEQQLDDLFLAASAK